MPKLTLSTTAGTMTVVATLNLKDYSNQHFQPLWSEGQLPTTMIRQNIDVKRDSCPLRDDYISLKKTGKKIYIYMSTMVLHMRDYYIQHLGITPHNQESVPFTSLKLSRNHHISTESSHGSALAAGLDEKLSKFV
jgi:hypothetical protein